MTKTTRKKKRPVLKTFLIAMAIIGIVAIVAMAMAPRYLAQQATQAPEDTGTFVTRQIEEADLSTRMQAAIENAPAQLPPAEVQVETQYSEPQGSSDGNSANTPQSTQNNTAYSQNDVDAQGLPPAQNQDNSEAPQETYGENTAQAPVVSQEQQPTYTEPPRSRPQAPTRAPQSQNDVPLQRPRDFQFQISQNEISGMIYSGLVRGTAPAYRQSIQGVSTQISGGRAKITVALLPKYLPDAFLQRLPGIDRSTPTVYLGGEMGLSLSGNNVEPRIHRVSLGNMGVPLPFIESAVRGQVQAYVRNATRLPNGQQAQLQNIQLENGAVQIQGRTP